jgi:hypothetical protein
MRPLLKIKVIKISFTFLLKLEKQLWQSASSNLNIDDGNWLDISPDSEQDVSNLNVSCKIATNSSPYLSSPCLPRPRDRPGPTLDGLLASIALADRIMCRKGVAHRLLAAASFTTTPDPTSTSTTYVTTDPSSAVIPPSISTYGKENSLDPDAPPFNPSNRTPTFPPTTTPLTSLSIPVSGWPTHSPHRPNTIAPGGITPSYCVFQKYYKISLFKIKSLSLKKAFLKFLNPISEVMQQVEHY